MGQRAYAAKQPRPGDVVLHCGHPEHDHQHWWGPYDGEHFFFTRPDGTTGQAQWIICWDPCFLAIEGDGSRMQSRVRGDGVWRDPRPVIRENHQ